MKRVRVTVRHNPKDPADDLRWAARLRRDLWAHSPVEIDPDSSIVRFTRWVRHDGSLDVRASD